MKSSTLHLALAVIGFTLCVNTFTAVAADEQAGQPAQRPPALAAPFQQSGAMDTHAPRMWRGYPAHRRGFRLLKCVLMVLLVCHVLLAAWIFTDIRKLGQGNGIFIILALLAGFPAAILYALVRIGDKKP